MCFFLLVSLFWYLFKTDYMQFIAYLNYCLLLKLMMEVEIPKSDMH